MGGERVVAIFEEVVGQRSLLRINEFWVRP